MSNNAPVTDLNSLKFPSGRSSGNLIKDTKAIKKSQGLTSVEALDVVCRENGSNLGLEFSIEVLSGKCRALIENGGQLAAIRTSMLLQMTPGKYLAFLGNVADISRDYYKQNPELKAIARQNIKDGMFD